MCVVSMSLPMYHSSVVVKLFLVRPLLLVCILLYLISLIYLPLLLLMSFASNFVLILACWYVVGLKRRRGATRWGKSRCHKHFVWQIDRGLRYVQVDETFGDFGRVEGHGRHSCKLDIILRDDNLTKVEGIVCQCCDFAVRKLSWKLCQNRYQFCWVWILKEEQTRGWLRVQEQYDVYM